MYDVTWVKCGLTYRQAQDIENKYLKDCFDGSAGGRKLPGKNYCVYTFRFGKPKTDNKVCHK